MKAIKNEQSGFSAVELILVIVIGLALIGIGLYVSHATNNSDNALNAANVTSSSVPPKFKNDKTSKAKTTSTTPSSSGTSKQSLQSSLNNTTTSSSMSNQDMTKASSAVNDQSSMTATP